MDSYSHLWISLWIYSAGENDIFLHHYPKLIIDIHIGIWYNKNAAEKLAIMLFQQKPPLHL